MTDKELVDELDRLASRAESVNPSASTMLYAIAGSILMNDERRMAGIVAAYATDAIQRAQEALAARNN